MSKPIKVLVANDSHIWFSQPCGEGKRLKYPEQDIATGGKTMVLLGMVELGSNNRITIPPRAVAALKLKKGDLLVFYEEDGSMVIKIEK